MCVCVCLCVCGWVWYANKHINGHRQGIFIFFSIYTMDSIDSMNVMRLQAGWQGNFNFMFCSTHMQGDGGG